MKEVVGIYVGTYYRHWDERDVESGMGGSETWAIEVSTNLAKRGYEVFLYADPESPRHLCDDNLHILPASCYEVDLRSMRYDYFIFSRKTEVISPYLKCDNVYVMVHDTDLRLINNDAHIGIGRVKKFGYLSEWHKDNLLSRYKEKGLTEDLLAKVTNGCSNKYYAQQDLYKTNSMIWSSGLYRGFEETYELVFSKIREQVPDFLIYVATCYNNNEWENSLTRRITGLPGVVVLDTLSKRELAAYQLNSKIWIYPGLFQETFCITAVENALAGNALICPLVDGLATTLSDIQYLKDAKLSRLASYYMDDYIDLAVRCLIDEEFRRSCAIQAFHACHSYSWERATQDWIDIFNSTK